eukprot:maker-scaffold330_size203968-snap-gene-0.20 protein:Tk05057 transcript:maker-scaffold330_size203968-snap-gene-0.20-mRNA-1 annotation:"hypothetical protein"
MDNCCFWCLLGVFLLVQAIGSIAGSTDPRIATRTTWPTESGTMVRILRSDQDMFEMNSKEDQWISQAASPFDFIRFYEKKKRILPSQPDNIFVRGMGPSPVLKGSKGDPKDTKAIRNVSRGLPNQQWGSAKLPKRSHPRNRLQFDKPNRKWSQAERDYLAQHLVPRL